MRPVRTTAKAVSMNTNHHVQQRALALAFGRPFGVAFAAFLREILKLPASELEEIVRKSEQLGAAALAADPHESSEADAPSSESHEQSLASLPAEHRAAAEAAWAEIDEQDRNGELLRLTLDRYTPEHVAANRLRSALKKRGITQAELARKLKVSPAAVSRILRDPERSAVKTLRRVAKALNVSVHDVIDE